MIEGRRVPDDTKWFEDGDYGRVDGVWHARPPGAGLGTLEAHDVTEHEDGTITVSPSILVTGRTTWHGYLERGVWREV